MRGNGLKVENKEREYITNLTALYVQALGRMIFSMGRFNRSILMAHIMLGSIIKGLNKETVNLFGRMVHIMKEILLKIKLKVLGLILGLVAKFILEIGKKG